MIDILNLYLKFHLKLLDLLCIINLVVDNLLQISSELIMLSCHHLCLSKKRYYHFVTKVIITYHVSTMVC